jgi:hypothetical protein
MSPQFIYLLLTKKSCLFEDADIKMAQYEAEARDKQWQEEKAEVSSHWLNYGQ